METHSFLVFRLPPFSSKGINICTHVFQALNSSLTATAHCRAMFTSATFREDITEVSSHTHDNVTTATPVDAYDDQWPTDSNLEMMFNVIILCVGLVGFMDNLFVVLVICGFTRLTRKIPGFLILNQTIIDLLNSVVLTVRYSLIISDGVSLPEGTLSWPRWAKDFYCRLLDVWWLLGGLLYASVWSLVPVNLERYLMIVHPLFHKKLTIRIFALPMVVAIWVCLPLQTFIWHQVTVEYVEEGMYCGMRSLENEAVSTYYNLHDIFLYGVPFVLIIYMYVRMILVLRLKSKQSFASAAANSQETAQRNLLKMLMLLSLAYLILWTPGTVMYTLKVLNVIEDNFVRSSIAIMLSMLTVCINPFIYIAKYKEFKAGMKKMTARVRVQPLWRQSNSSNTAETGTSWIWLGVFGKDYNFTRCSWLGLQLQQIWLTRTTTSLGMSDTDYVQLQ